ncbi:MAG TPA: HIT family protein [Bryobacteraceae bacterium]|nr:HIT family protein [Bryobacteraceae bacterium]
METFYRAGSPYAAPFPLHHEEMAAECLFCKIAGGSLDAAVVFQDALTLAFLDHRPLFPGHCLLVPKAHIETLADLPCGSIQPLFANARLLSLAVEQAMGAEGSFVAINNRVSQSVPHLHIHVVPRRRKDGLRGFFWPRGKYRDAEEMEAARASIERAVRSLQRQAG